MGTHISHAALPWPVKNARYTVLVPYLDADGDPTDPTTPDTEVSQDGGAFANATETPTTITGSNGMAYITFTATEMNNSAVGIAFKVASGPKATLMTLYPRVLPILESGTAQAGAAGSITLASGAAAYDLAGCIVRTTGGTGGGGANNQARVVTAYNTSTKVATVVPNWETTPDATTTYDVLYTDLSVNAIAGRFLRPTVDERTLDVSATGEAGVDWANVGSPTTTVGLSGTTVKTATDVETKIGANTDAATDPSAASGTLFAKIRGAGDNLDTIDDFLDTEIAAILAAVDTEVAAILALLDDARTEPGQGTPPVNPDLATKIDYLYKAWRNRTTQTPSQYSLYADNATTLDHKATFSDDGTTADRGEIAAGP